MDNSSLLAIGFLLFACSAGAQDATQIEEEESEGAKQGCSSTTTPSVSPETASPELSPSPSPPPSLEPGFLPPAPPPPKLPIGEVRVGGTFSAAFTTNVYVISVAPAVSYFFLRARIEPGI